MDPVDVDVNASSGCKTRKAFAVDGNGNIAPYELHVGQDSLPALSNHPQINLNRRVQLSPPPSVRPYISKRKRTSAKEQPAAASKPDFPPLPARPPAVSRGDESDICQLPRRRIAQLSRHENGVTALRWGNAQKNEHLMLSSGIDGVIQLHNVFGMLVADEFGTDVSAHTLRVFRIDAAVKDVRWSIGGDRFYSAGMDSRLRVFDIVRGVELHEFINSDPVSSICCHPTDPNLVLAGMSRNGISCWDTRSNKVCRQFKSQFGQVHDMMFTPPETIRFKPAVQLPSSLNTTFISTSDVLSRSTSGHGILEWDFHSGLVVSSQLYSEGFSCTALRLHPYGQQFVAQSHENCILTFSLAGKRKLVNHKTFRGHFTAANNISLSFSPDGQFLSTGSSTGEIHHFEYSSGRPVKVVQNAHARTACVCVEWAKCTGILGNQQGSVMVSAGWDGTVSVWK